MSRRTAESNKAIATAWENEQQRVSEGKGIRDWTPEQQQDILKRGKAYDNNGKAFEGQHMRSAEMYPEYQGSPDNIQFLTREEHLAAHDGNWQNPTNWYYNPVTRQKADFGDGPVIPCEVIELSSPIVQINTACDVKKARDDVPRENVEPETKKRTGTVPLQKSQATQKGSDVQPQGSAMNPTQSGFMQFVTKAGRGIGKAAKKTGMFLWKHKWKIIAVAGSFAAVASEHSRDSEDDSSSRVSDYGNTFSGAGYDSAYSEDSDDCSSEERSYPEKRQSPCEHDVSGYTRHWNGKEIHVDPYKRGGRKPEDE